MSQPELATAPPKAGGTVLLEKQGPVWILTLAYPERRNALSLELREPLHDLLAQAMVDKECRVIVLTGQGANFSSGGDISSFDGITAMSGRLRMQRVQRIVRLLVRGEKPVIAAVEGYAVGAGLCLAAACDIVVASSEAKFSCTFNKIGLAPDLAGAWTLPMRMGLGKAKMLMMSGRTLDAETAERQGLVELVTPAGQALTQAIELAQEMAQASPLSNGLTKAMLSRGPQSLEELMSAEADTQAILYATEDFQEGRTAFLAKRKPVFQGK